MFIYDKFFLLLVCLLYLIGCTQNKFNFPKDGKEGFIDLSSIQFCGAFEFSDSAKKMYSLSPASSRAMYIISQMKDYSGISLDITICKGKVPNALATTIDNKKIIIYNEDFLDDIDKKSQTYFWQSVFILAHEVGHHLYEHTLASDTALRFQQELQADEFAGFILYRMGAPIEVSTWIMRTTNLQTPSGDKTHPPRQTRNAAIEKGWQKGYVQTFTIPVPPPPPFDSSENNNFIEDGYFDCSKLLENNQEIYGFHSDHTTGCKLDSLITTGAGIIDFLVNDSTVGPEIYRDTLIGVIMSLDKDDYNYNLGGFLKKTNARIRILKYNKQLNPLFKNYNLYVSDISCPSPLEGAWNFFTKTFKPGQWVKFKVIVENSTIITNTYRFSYLKFIAPPTEISNQIFSPFSKNYPK